MAGSGRSGKRRGLAHAYTRHLVRRRPSGAGGRTRRSLCINSTACHSFVRFSSSRSRRLRWRARQAVKPTTLPRRGRRLDRFKADAASKIDARAKMAQEMVDSVFSFGELGFQEFETSRYLTGILEKNGFTVERGDRRASRPPGSRAGGRASRSSRSVRTSTASRRPHRSRASPTIRQSSTARPVMAKATTPACRSTSSPRLR